VKSPEAEPSFQTTSTIPKANPWLWDVIS
jgi:hypothetical protein